MTMTMRFSFGYGFDLNMLETFNDIARTGDEFGFDIMATGCTPALKGEVFVGLSLIAQHTRNCRVSSFIINPVTWHPVMMACGFSTIDAISNGRAVVGMGTGDTGVYNLGLKPAKMAYMEEYIKTLRELWATGESQWQGTTVKTTQTGRRIPIFMAPAGPKGLNLAGRIADGVFIETGVLPAVVEDSLRRLEEGAKQAGRSLDEIEVWWHMRPALGSSRDDAVDQISSTIVSMANRLARFNREGKQVPDDIWEKLQEMKARYDFMAAHEDAEKDKSEQVNAKLLDELGLRDYLAARFALVGTSEDWVKRLQELYGLGVRNIAFAGMMKDRVGFLRKFGEEILPHVANSP
jgi:5,10-methylenetetrahydromethanopterin reductase